MESEARPLRWAYQNLLRPASVPLRAGNGASVGPSSPTAASTTTFTHDLCVTPAHSVVFFRPARLERARLLSHSYRYIQRWPL